MTIDPYKTLGVTPEASADDIKKAYRTLSRKYHPDANINNPYKAQAEEKFKEVQVAYDRIIKDRENGIYGGYTGGYSQGAYGGQSTGQQGYGQSTYGQNVYGQGTYGSENNNQGAYGYGFNGNRSNTYTQSQEEINRLRAAANYINAGNYREALTVLEAVRERNAAWYYYSALANQGIGNNVNALNAARQATAMEPDNFQFQVLLRKLEGGGAWYENMGESYGRAAGGATRVCSTLCWISLLCNCCFMRPY